MQRGVMLSATAAYARCGLHYRPNAMQEALYDVITGGDCAVLLKAPTGTGKMEAVVIPALSAERRLVLIYPALSLIEDQEMRLAQILRSLSAVTQGRSLSLIVDTGAQMYRRLWAQGEEQGRERRHLYHGDIILTTLDKFLYRFFGFGETKKSYTYPLRLRYGRQPLFCFDEAHSYDEVAYTNFVDLVRTIGFNADAPRDVVVMTATMPRSYEHDLQPLLTILDFTTGERGAALAHYYAQIVPRPHPGKAFTYLPVPIGNREVFCQHLLSLVAQNHRQGQRTIITVEEVETAVLLYRLLLEGGQQDLLLYHGRQPHPMRRQIYAALKQAEEEDRGYLLVTTSAIEVGCDLDGRLMLTQLCNPEQLVQRAGRCNRRGATRDAQIIAVGDRIPDYLCTLAAQSEIEQYLSALEQMADQGIFEPTALAHLRRKHPLPDYRVQTMFAMLYEYVYQAERANKPLHDKGLVITRSWEPTVTLTTGWDERGRMQDALQISMLRCIARSASQVDSDCEVLVRFYDEYAEHYTIEPPRAGGCAYHQEIIVRVPPSYLDPVTGYERVPRVFLRAGSRQGYRRWLSALVGGQPPTSAPVQPPPKATSRSAKRSSAPPPTDDGQQKKVRWWYLDKLPTIEGTLDEDTSGTDSSDMNLEDELEGEESHDDH
jgi:CRISPR-associated endonuclease/helicase Cas3